MPVFWRDDWFILWNTSKKCKLGLGVTLCYGDHPLGTQCDLLPTVDFVRCLVVFI